MTFLNFVVKYMRYVKTLRKPSKGEVPSERGTVKALGLTLQATSCVARDDRDGGSRYRASKMSDFRRIRVVPRFMSPLCSGAAFILPSVIIIWR